MFASFRNPSSFFSARTRVEDENLRQRLNAITPPQVYEKQMTYIGT
ncbi:hypothetical protein HMPREF9141_1465 [Prevotella multiformis DSM 16608]|uniref:Uncharacterized protein n=1 Tax=Prevotella multiformis DSM 16608 TaxID=888743 RepID=F0F798_9BACT|nr:hypothetical protein HMPREF9141_1465 [Prevotella multiformis DSM 16608]